MIRTVTDCLGDYQSEGVDENGHTRYRARGPQVKQVESGDDENVWRRENDGRRVVYHGKLE
jgi:hypothetical protein